MLLLFFLCLSWYVFSQNQMTIPLTGNPVQTTATFNIDMQYTGTTFKSISYGYLSGLGVSMFGGQCYGPADPTAVQRLRLMNKEGVRLAQHAGLRTEIRQIPALRSTRSHPHRQRRNHWHLTEYHLSENPLTEADRERRRLRSVSTSDQRVQHRQLRRLHAA
jgi:hypothetical protein